MRILYIAPRYHTNQVPIMKGMKENHHQIFFFSHYAGKIENYDYVMPEIIGYSKLYQWFDRFYVEKLHPDDPMARDFMLLKGFPPIFKLNKRMKAVKPDLVIIRERSVYSMVSYVLCKLHRYTCILYNQSPLWEESREDLAHRVVDSLTPSVRMTPVKGEEAAGLHKDPNAFFVPFVMEAKVAPDRRDYFRDGKIHIFTVGKYEKRKNLQMMLEVFRELQNKYPITLTIAGEYTAANHIEIYDSLCKYIEEHQLKGVTLKKNLTKEEMDREYLQADLFVIPSTGEPASISQLEAMAFSIPVICSDTNGTACYVQDGFNGFRFVDKSQDNLLEKVEAFLKEPKMIKTMGANANTYLQNHCRFDNYFTGIMQCMEAAQRKR